MPNEEPLKKRKVPVFKLALLAVILAVGALLVLRGVDVRALGKQGMTTIRAAGAWAFFGAIVVLPAIGAPLSPFTLSAGEAFAPTMTMAGVVLAVLAAIAGNLALSYWLARYALRPILSRLAAYYGYRVPRVTKANSLSIILVLRLTPGIPFFMQSYILGLAEVPFRLYMMVSWLCTVPMVIGAVILGEGIFGGHLKTTVIGVVVIVVAVIVVHWLRKRYASRVA
ncbi:MAG TPA: VTT domain-containing protein [Opitutaceae bacterium]|jgi:uncharacterized membrane protein YdjX (TVP38/TMEM64 family)